MPSRGAWRRVGRAACVAFACAGLLGCAQGGGEGQARQTAEKGVAPLVTQAERSRKSGDFDRAIDAYRQAYTRTPWNERLKRALAVTFTERALRVRNDGQLPAAEQDLREALELYPGDVDFQRNLAVVLVERAQASFDPAEAESLVGEARRLDPTLEVPEQVLRGGIERRLDLAFELLERGQLEAGIDRLEALRLEFPDEPQAVRLLAQAKGQLADGYARRANFVEARRLLDEVVTLYREIEPCDGQRCSAEELRAAHYNRCVILINSREDGLARTALDEARASGLSFPDLEKALRP